MENSDNTKTNPYQNTNIFFSLTFEWLTPFIYNGFKKPLEESDIYDLPREDQIQNIYPSFAKNFNRDKKWRAYEHITVLILNNKIIDLWCGHFFDNTVSSSFVVHFSM